MKHPLIVRARFLLSNLFVDRRGANMAEYLIICGLVACVALAAFQTFGTTVRGKVDKESEKLDGVNF